MKSDKELLRDALTALEVWSHRDPDSLPIVKEIRDRLAKPEPDPVAWLADSPTMGNGLRVFFSFLAAKCYAEDVSPLYRHPPRPTGLDQLIERIRFLEQQIEEKKNNERIN